MPAGYTYLGQFIDHDLTMDVTDVEPRRGRLAGRAAPGALAAASTSTRCTAPGRPTPESAKFYEADGLHLKTGDTVRAGPDRREGRPRPAAGRHGRRREAKRKALIPDPRNDENLIVAQTHLAMIRFHNRVVDKLPASTPPGAEVPPGAQDGDAALPVADPARLPAADRRRRTSSTTCSPTGASWSSRRRPRPTCPTMPIEFSVAGVPARAQHGPRGVRLEPPVPRRRRVALLHVRLLGARRRHPRRQRQARQQLDRRLAADVRLPRRRAPRPGGPERRQHGAADRHPASPTR